jgi:alginate O-acetyltransferase complex protein AlgI
MIGWVFFRSPDLPYAIEFLRRLCGVDAMMAAPIAAFDLVTTRSLVTVALVAVLAFPLWPWAKARWWHQVEARGVLAANLASSAFVVAVMVLCFATMASQQSSPFLYFRF